MELAFAHDLEFHKLRQGCCEIDVSRLLLEFARDAYPELDPEPCLRQLSDLRHQACERTERIRRIGGGTFEQLEELSRFLCHDEHFRGNHEDYYDPRNSYLNEVLSRRVGIPLTLSVLYAEVGRAAGLDLYGVCTPAHFVVGCASEHQRWFVDTFHGGDVLTMCECRQRIEQLLSQGHCLSEAHFRAAQPFDIAVRMLRNLKASYVSQAQWDMALPVQQRLEILLPQLPGEKRDLGLICLRIGQPQLALRHLHRFHQAASTEEQQQVAPYLDLAYRLLAEMN